MFIQSEDQELIIDIDQVRSFEPINENEKFKIMFYFKYSIFRENGKPIYKAIWEFESEEYRNSVVKELMSRLKSQGKMWYV